MAAPRLDGVLCAGNIVLDVVVRPVDQVGFDATAWVDSIEQHLGGNGASTAHTLAVLGVPVRLLGWVGRDGFGDLLVARLKTAGVDVSAVVRAQGPTPATVALVNSRGERCLLHRPGASWEAFAQPVEFSPALVRGVSHFHLGNPFGLPLLRQHVGEVLRGARAAGLSTSVDTGWDAQGRWLEDLGPCLPSTNLLFPNQEEALQLTGLDDVADAARRLREMGAGSVILKLGDKGCAVFTPDGESSVPAFQVEAVDTTGAGDCFVGGFLAALHRGRSWLEAARFANAVAALTVQKLGATAGLRSWAETEAWMAEAEI